MAVEKCKTYAEAVAFVKGLQAGGILPKQVHPVGHDGNIFVQLNSDENGRWTHDVTY